ncbi:uncharacterized protein LY89DRAFT_669511 [Mollisia scopiformis]|uniref:F-box domain-containing protein n=1 Tax=Mollisia scopiformis TaxID=149040 RepID=A0A194XA89_MOLSC|nr:uncharacterized protein LY89DRAFT_669511 [Mollisia scopiformis]KUJ17088.1 hypothetical protein LY89DRAFT_669511 [Mollisia scopiformis]
MPGCYKETVCQLCGVSFAITRFRRAEEDSSKAWAYYGSDYSDSPICGVGSGCTALPRDDSENGEHLAGPGCVCTSGYSGYRISVEEMRGCRSVVVILKKEEDWEEESDDQEFEKEGGYFLTGVGDGSPDEAPLEGLTPVRHGVEGVWIWNTVEDVDEEMGLPMHPSCFEIWKRISIEKTGKVDLHDIWAWRQLEGSYEAFFERFPRHPAVRQGKDQWWEHKPGAEWLAANPIDIPGLNLLINSCYREKYNVNRSVHPVWRRPFPTTYSSSTTPNDPFWKLPQELRFAILEPLSGRDIANLRLVTPAYRDLPVILFRAVILSDFPWLWEIRELEVGTTMWYTLYMSIKFGFGQLMGVRNRRRVWQDVEEIWRRVERYKREGRLEVGLLKRWMHVVKTRRERLKKS